MTQIRAIMAAAAIEGQQLPILSFDVNESIQAEFTTAEFTSSIVAFKAAGIQPPKKGDTVDIYAGFDGQVDRYFSGVIDDCRFKWGKDRVEIEARDLGAVLSQSKMVMSKYQYKNQTIGKIVKQIAEDFGLQAEIDDPGIMAGSEQHDQYHYLPNADNPWTLIQNLARQCGYHARVTKDHVLQFKSLDQDEGSVSVYWFPDAQSQQTKILRDDFETDLQLSRSGDVKVKVYSWLPTKKEKITAEATATAENPSGGSNKKNAVVGSETKKKSKRVRSSSKKTETPTIVIRRPGLTQEQADALAKSVAKDVSKRQIIVTGSVELDQDITVQKKLKIKIGGMDILGFDSIDYIIGEAHHQLSDSGMFSTFKALLRPEVS